MRGHSGMRVWRTRAQTGFTIMEILVALTLLAVVMLLGTRAFLTILSVTNRGGNLTVASGLAAKKLEEVRTLVEAQPNRTTWRTGWCANIVAQPTTAFPAPYAAYSYRVLINDSAISAKPGQEALLLPCWGIDWAVAARCPAPGYSPTCAGDSGLLHEERMRWVTIEVFRGGAQPIVQLTSAIIRGAYHR